ncbi:hypothetical protein FB451DRAFT_1365994 [Mycena latifolia]|nr:hypothetical protein FB451DRAFT_1365994 [Mycena latifolia]
MAQVREIRIRRGQVRQKQAHVRKIMELRQDKCKFVTCPNLASHLDSIIDPSPPAAFCSLPPHFYDFQSPNVFIPQEQSLGLRTDNRDLAVHRDHGGGEASPSPILSGRTVAFTPASSARLARINAPWAHATSIWGQI